MGAVPVTREIYFTQARALLNARRYADAEARLLEWLGNDPDDARAHALLAYTLYAQDRSLDALREAETAIGLEPGWPAGHYVRALALLELGRASSALKAIAEALRLDPENSQYHAGLARIYVRKKNWKRALAAAERGLQFDPENSACANLRGMALVNMGRKDEADQAITTALARDPENASTHANQGWALLHRLDHKRALTHFREALRLDPMSDWARQGIVEALKARNPVYRLLLRYFLWMSRLTTTEQWETVSIVSSVWRALRIIARQVPILYVVVLPISLVYFLFAVLTWTARPLFALVLRFDRFGRLALPREEIVASNWVAVCLLTSFGSLILGTVLALIFGNFGFLVLSIVALALVVPVSGVFRADPGVGRVILAVYTGLLACIGVGAFIVAIFGSWMLAVAGVLLIVFVVGWVFYSWGAGLIIMLARKRSLG
ncbi:MAG: tetratricopeptide repeat protein [Anaerolineae bacterium]|nr:tetratricopeptide repeat protein [Anaerolineae bacterium]